MPGERPLVTQLRRRCWVSHSGITLVVGDETCKGQRYIPFLSPFFPLDLDWIGT